MKEKKTFQPLSSKDICLIYELLHGRNFVSFPLTQEGIHKVESLVATVTGAYFGEEIYKTQQEKALAYLYFLIKDHPFIDGNKRTASLVFSVICKINKLESDYSLFKLDQIAIFIEKINEPDHHNVIRILSELIFKK